MMNVLEQPISCLKGVGSRVSERLSRLEIFRVIDLLLHLPWRYQDRTQLMCIADLSIGQEALIDVEITSRTISSKGRRSLILRVRDHSALLTLRFFYFQAWQVEQFAIGTRLRVFGEIRSGRSGLEMYHPEYRIIQENEPEESTPPPITAIYPSVEGLRQSLWRQLIKQALALMLSNPHVLPELLETVFIFETEFTSLRDALHYVHQPPADASLALLNEGLHPAQQRLAFEEIFSHQLAMRQQRQAIQRYQSVAFFDQHQACANFIKRLPFQLTKAQERVWREIQSDLQNTHAMLRLLQGDVGSGKTVIAALATLIVASQGYQVALMAPTELLAEQHFATFSRWFENTKLELAWLSGKLTEKRRQITLEHIANHQVQIVIGTHALFQTEVHFAALGLAIIDEQHRFGVHQRLALREKGEQSSKMPHQLIMTATPIPRTLSMSAYGDLDVSILDELPANRKPVTTVLIDAKRRASVIERIRQACQLNQQAYWVCTLIEESEQINSQAAEATCQYLKQALPELEIGLLHGRVKSQEKISTMAAFKAGKINLLVATTVIEVGIDVPNANIMVIENAERLGLAQLHQLRGRIGRGDKAGFCLLLYQSPLSAIAQQRLNVMRRTQDGFVIAQEDLLIRGPGEILGTRQTGILQFKIANLQRDQALLNKAYELASSFSQLYPEQSQALINRWLGQQTTQYAQV